MDCRKANRSGYKQTNRQTKLKKEKKKKKEEKKKKKKSVEKLAQVGG